MSNRPTPPHHRTLTISESLVRNGYGGVRTFGDSPIKWIIVAAAPVDAADPPPAGKVRVVVAPARGPR